MPYTEITKKLNDPPVPTIRHWTKIAGIKVKRPYFRTRSYNGNLSFEELEPALCKWARYFCKKYSSKFDFWELISSVWLKGQIQYVEDIKMASCMIKCDMIDYIRSKIGVKNSRRNKDEFSRQSLELELSNREGCLLREVISDRHDCFREVETRDIWNYILNNRALNEQDKIILKLRFIDSLTQREVASKIGFSEASISLKLNGILRKLKAVLAEKGIKSACMI